MDTKTQGYTIPSRGPTKQPPGGVRRHLLGLGHRHREPSLYRQTEAQATNRECNGEK